MVYPIARHTIFPAIRFFLKKTEGIENLPARGPFLIACKHIGPLDGLFVASVVIPRLNQKVSFVANVAKWGWFWEKIVGEQWADCIPFDKDNPSVCISVAAERLHKGKVVGIFPEGIIQDYDEKKSRAKTGAARLAISTKVPIVPVGLVHDVSVRPDLPKLYRRRQVIKNFMRHPHSLEIHFGKPFTLDSYYDKELNKERLIDATNEIMNFIDKLTNINRIVRN